MEMITVALSALALVVSVAGVVVSYLVARKYGDLAALKAARELHEEDARKARVLVLRSLLNEAARVRKIGESNATVRIGVIAPVARLPVTAFKTAFVSGTPGLQAGEELLQAVADYLACADSVNGLIDVYPAAVAGRGNRSLGTPGNAEYVVEQVADICRDKLPGMLDRLEHALREEINASSA